MTASSYCDAILRDRSSAIFSWDYTVLRQLSMPLDYLRYRFIFPLVKISWHHTVPSTYPMPIQCPMDRHSSCTETGKDFYNWCSNDTDPRTVNRDIVAHCMRSTHVARIFDSSYFCCQLEGRYLLREGERLRLYLFRTNFITPLTLMKDVPTSLMQRLDRLVTVRSVEVASSLYGGWIKNRNWNHLDDHNRNSYAS